MSRVEDEVTWPLLLRTGFGNVFPNGRWDHASTYLIADAVNSDDWTDVIRYAQGIGWDEDEAC